MAKAQSNKEPSRLKASGKTVNKNLADVKETPRGEQKPFRLKA